MNIVSRAAVIAAVKRVFLFMKLGIGLMTIVNLIIIIPMSKEAIKLLDKKD